MAEAPLPFFRSEAWRCALERYGAATHLTVEVIGLDGERLGEPVSPTGVFDLLAGSGHDPGLFAACAHRCLAQPPGAAPVVEERYGLAVVGTSLTLGAKTVGAAVAGYVPTAFPDRHSTQRLALDSGVPLDHLWAVLRRQLPLAHERLLVYGELLQALCDALVSEHHRTQQLAETAKKLGLEAEAKDQFLAMLSHELRTPLTAMLGWANMLHTRKLNAADIERAHEVFERNTRLQARLIDELLDVSRIVSGKVDLKRRPVEPGLIVETAVAAFRPAAETKGLRLVVALDPAAGLVAADPERFEQIVANLVSNAIKFTPGGGQIDVQLRKAEDGVHVTVSDTGVGIAPEFLPFVFDRFSQADTTNTRLYGGLGLGLAIVRHLVELHGGKVQAASPGTGRGATFTVWLPALSDAATHVSEPFKPPGQRSLELSDVPRLDGVRVLLVDDEADTRELFTRILQEQNGEVVAVSSVAEALNILEHWRPDVLVSDVGMAQENGYDLIRKLRALPPDERAAIPAIALTAHAQPEEGRRARAAGFQLHLPKPVVPATLALAVAQLAGRLEAG